MIAADLKLNFPDEIAKAIETTRLPDYVMV